MKFSIRDLLLVTVIVALAAGWWVDRSHLAWSGAQTARACVICWMRRTRVGEIDQLQAIVAWSSSRNFLP